MSVNYTAEQVKMMTSAYTENPSRETVEKLSEELDKSIKSIIGKLSREGVYKKTVYKTKTGETPVTKKQIVQDIADLLEIDYMDLAGLVKAPKPELKNLLEGLGHYDSMETENS
tara:strand:- start:671 stop:1012 length:342 start_codon:yes stop_codon:yes gene_type:complete